MDTNVIAPNDPRFRPATATVRGKTYRYFVSEPEGTPVDTIFLIHGFPDMAYGWRHQVPALTSIGLRVVVPDLLGYAGTDAPESLEAFSLKNMSADINELAKQIVGEGNQIILGGHDWGGALIFRIILWHPNLIKAVFSVCTPYGVPRSTYVPLEVLVEKVIPTFKYQLQLAGPEVEQWAQGEERIRHFLNTLWNGQTADGKFGMRVDTGVLFDVMPKIEKGLLSEEDLNHYVKEYMRHSPELRGPLNWYRMHKVNFEDEQTLYEQGVGQLDLPVLFIAASQDVALPPQLSASMDETCKNLTRGEVDCTHWALVERPKEVNELIVNWVKEKVFSGDAKASL